MKSIKLKLLLIFTVIIFILSAGIGVFTVTVVTDQLLQDAHSHLSDMAQQEAKYIQASVEGRLSYVSSLAQNPILLDDKLTFEQKVAFFETEAQRTGYLAFAFADKEGNSTVFNSARETTNIASREYFQTALKGQAAVSDVIVSSATQELVMIFAAPVYSQGEIVGVIYGRRSGNTLSEMIQEVSYKQTGYAYMINNQGVTVGHKNTDLVIAQDNDIENMKTDESLRELGELTQKMTSGIVGSGEYTYNGVTKIAGYAPVENTPWIVIFGIEKNEILTSVKLLQNTLIIIAIMAVAIGAVTTYFASSSIAKPIREVTVAAQEIARGQFDVTLSVKSKDEVGRLAEAFNLTLVRLTNYQGYIDEISEALSYMAQGNLTVSLQKEYVGQFKKLKDNLEILLDGLSATLRQIHQAAEQVAIGSEQVSSGAQALAAGSTEQAASIQELSASIEQIAKQAEDSSSRVAVASESVQQAAVGVNAGNEHMEQLTQAMSDIDSASGQIATITKVIEDIAFQTNILALNAAIEAARAGAAGKGFAVVADEVRNLAAKSAEAAKQTGDLIRASVGTVAKGTEIAEQAARILLEVGASANEVSGSFGIIEQSIAEQAGAIEQIKQGISQISAVVQTNAATAEENSATSEEMSAQAATLRQEVSKFQLTN